MAVDCLRGDTTSLLGYDRETTPFLDSIAGESLVFEQHYSVTPDRLPSHGSLLTGCDPRIGNRPALPGLPGDSLYFPEKVPRLARSFLAAGYRTAAFPDSPRFSASLGFESGFEKLITFGASPDESSVDRGMSAVAHRFERWLRSLGSDESWFAYMQVQDLERIWHFEDPVNDRRFDPRPELDFVPPLSANSSSFFAVPKRLWSGAALTVGEYQARYEGNLREFDQRLGHLVGWLQRKGLWDSTTLVITGTHGVGFGEEGIYLESKTLTASDLRVPLLIRPAPGLRLPTGTRFDQLSCHLDIAPTLLELSGLKIPKGMHGLSLETLIKEGGDGPRRHVFAQGGFFEGFAVISKQDHFLRISMRSNNNTALRSSYFGSPERFAQGGDGYHMELRNIETGEPLPLQDERAIWLTNVGSTWFRWIRKAQLYVYDRPTDEETQLELLRRGLIATEPGI